jgi:hypothetical protein
MADTKCVSFSTRNNESIKHIYWYVFTHTHTHSVRNITTNEVQQATLTYYTITYLYSMLI